MNLAAHLVSIGGPNGPLARHVIRPTAALPTSNAEHKEAVMVKLVSALSLVIGVIAGYAVGGTGVIAQTSPQGVALATDDEVTLIYPQVRRTESPRRLLAPSWISRVRTYSAHRSRSRPNARSTSRLSWKS